MNKKLFFYIPFFNFFIFILILCTTFLIGAAAPCMAQTSDEVRTSLFEKADQTLQSAKSMKADLLAPIAFQRGWGYYQQAEKMYERGKELADIRVKLNSAIEHFKKAMEAVKIAMATFDRTISARENALAAEAPVYEPQLWSMAEEMFSEAASDLEKGYLKQAKKEAARAVEKYSDAELKAIKASYLNKGFQLIEQAKMEGAERYALKTLTRAQDLINNAEKQLTANRYETEEPKKLATEAKHEALHAITISKIAEKLKESSMSIEDLILKHENLLRQIGETLQIETSFEKGLEEAVGDIVKTIELYRGGEQAQVQALQDRVQKLGQDVASRDEKIEKLTSELNEHAKKLRSAEEEAFVYARQLAEQEEIKQTFIEMEKMFDPSVATVLRREKEVIIQLFGLSFPPGKSVIEPQYFPLLTQVQNAIDLFPRCNVMISGHTDSIGNEKTNLELSLDRAQTVRQYLLANMGISRERIEAIGFGESQPIASNDTKQGRERNRRIDIIIRPEFPTPLQHEHVSEEEAFPEEVNK